MDTNTLQTNLYGDKLVSLSVVYGADIASQRADWMDADACEQITKRARSSETKPRALDIGCGFGGQIFRMAQAGAHAIGVDSAHFDPEQRRLEAEKVVSGRIDFYQQNLMSLPQVGRSVLRNHFDVVVCQRTIHYLKHDRAQTALDRMGAVLKPGGFLYLSASGLGSELSEGYSASVLPVSERFAELGQTMATKHQILTPVCLYTLSELEALVEGSGFTIIRSEVSAFGNIKVAAVRP